MLTIQAACGVALWPWIYVLCANLGTVVISLQATLSLGLSTALRFLFAGGTGDSTSMWALRTQTLYYAAAATLVAVYFYVYRKQSSKSPIAHHATTKPDPEMDVITVATNVTPQLYALVIGIDDYPNLQPLRGAVSDAESITQFLTIDLGVPSDHITNLRNQTASRTGIIQAFQALQRNDEIKPGSPILIYYAGHGGVQTVLEDASEEWKEWKKRYGANSKIQVIFPFDYGMEDGGEKVNCIPDKTIGKLLNQLAKAKGDNITVIFDSCHSAAGSRAAGGRQARSTAVTFSIPANIDDDILPPGPTSLAAARNTEPLFCTHQSSHIHFAACGSDEQAWEENGRGEFTTALLKKIRACGVDKITYQNLMSELPWLSKQTPHCYGANKSRILFNACIPSRKIVYIPVIYDPFCRTLTLQAGASSGVTGDSVWEIRESAAEGDKGIVGRAKTGPPGASRATLTPEEIEGDDLFWSRCEAGTPWQEGKKKLYARLITSGPGNELKVWFSPEAKSLIFPKLEGGAAEEPMSKDHEVGYVIHPTKDSADIAVELYQSEGTGEGRHRVSASGSSGGPGTKEEVEFHLCNPDARKYGTATLQKRKPARQADVETVLFAAARWNWHLQRTNPVPTRASVDMEMFKVAEKRQVNGEYLDEWNFVEAKERVNLSETGVVDFKVHEKDLYAVRLKSRATVPLYARMFYFDTTSFSIVDLFAHSVSNSRADPVIPTNGEFIIGDRADGEAPLHFGLDPGETIDVGYLKVFWSTDPLELDHLAQDSAFDMKVGAQSRKFTKNVIVPATEWGSVLLKLVQRASAEV